MFLSQRRGISQGASVDVLIVERRDMFPRYLLSIHCIPSLLQVVPNIFQQVGRVIHANIPMAIVLKVGS